MSSRSFDFRVGSLNIRGINKHSKRIATFNWVKNKNFDVTFLQETYSAKTDENLCLDYQISSVSISYNVYWVKVKALLNQD